MATVIAGTGLVYRFPDGTTALDGVDLGLRSGECLALVGANGAGKSTLLQLLAGLLEPNAGTLTIDAQPIGRSAADRRRWCTTTALVLQDPDDQMVAPTVWEDVGFGPANLGLPTAEIAQRVDQALAWMNITALADRPPHLLSYGQRKRVCLAGALAMRPRALLLDEPAAGLDPAGEAQLLATLKHLVRDHGLSILLATHAVDVLPDLADRIAVLGQGRLLCLGAPAEVFADHDLLTRAGLRLPYVAELMFRLQQTGQFPPGPVPLTIAAAEAAVTAKAGP